jgi:hypothetical protein
LRLRQIDDPRAVAKFSDADVDNWVRNEIAGNDITAIYSRLAAHEKANALLTAQTLQVSDENISDLLDLMLHTPHYEFRGITKASNMRAAYETLSQARGIAGPANQEKYELVLGFLREGAAAAEQMERVDAQMDEVWQEHGFRIGE